MKFNNGDNFHLQGQLEALKGDLAQALLQFSEVMKQNLLMDILKLSSLDKNKFENESCLDAFKSQIEYIRNFLLMTTIFPKDLRLEIGWKILRDCDYLLKGVFQEVVKVNQTEDADGNEKHSGATQQQVVSLLILPTAQLIHDCIDMNLAGIIVGESGKELKEAVKHCVSMLDESTTFLISSVGISLGKPDFLRIMGIGQKVWKFAQHLTMLSSPEMKASNEMLMGAEVDKIEDVLSECILVLLSSENGRSFLKFCFEVLSTLGKKSKVCESLKQFSLSATHFPEIYMVFTSYIEDMSFWKTEMGKALTPILIRGIMVDMTCDKVETRKRAAFVLKLLVDQYSQSMPVFDQDVPEVSYISLNNMKPSEHAKFWDSYFDLYDILNETQLHIVQPVLTKIQIFKDHSLNQSVLIWLPIILRKMICHDNRSVVKEGFEQFLQVGRYLENPESEAYRQLLNDFFEKSIMPLIRDHIGWILNEPEEYFKNISMFGDFLVCLYSNQDFPQFKAAEIILDFLTSSGKCMGPHTIYFLVASLDEIFGNTENIMNMKIGLQENVFHQKILSTLELLMSQLALLLSNNLTTVGKYFRQLLEHRCVNILLKITPFIEILQGIQLDSLLFMKLLTFLGSISTKVFYSDLGLEKIKSITASFNKTEQSILGELLEVPRMYVFCKSKLSSTSSIGMLRFVAVSSQVSNKDISAKIIVAVEHFTISNSKEEILPGSTQGLSEFYQHIPTQNMFKIYIQLIDEICEKLAENVNDFYSVETFMFHVRRLEVLSVLPNEAISKFEKRTPVPNLNFSSCALQAFLLQKLCFVKCMDEISIDVMTSLVSRQSRKSDVNDTIADRYFAVTGRNFFAEFHLVQFGVCAVIVNKMSETAMDKDVLKNLLTLVLDEIEKCDSKGVASGLLLAKSVTTLIDYRDDWDGMHLLDEIASVGWSLVFELRKSEAFWFGINAFVELISCPYFVKNGSLNKYSDMIFEHGDTVSGLSLVLVQYLVKLDYPDDLLNEVHQVLVKAALAGGPLPKNNRVSFAIWGYLREKGDEEDNDPENFSSDCKARLLACEKLRSNIDCLLSRQESKVKALTLLRETILTVLERNDVESIKRKRYFQGSSTHRIKQRIWQILLTLQPYFDFEISKLVLEKVLHALSMDSPQPSVRYMGEWLIILIVKRFPELNGLFFDCLDNCVQKRLGFGAFFSTICLHVSKHLECSAFYDKALQSLATLTLSQHLTVRIYSQVAFQKIYERTVTLNLVPVIQKYEPVLSALLRASVFVSGNCSKLLENVSQDFYVNVFDAVAHFRPEVIFTLLPRLSGMIQDECSLLPTKIRKMVPPPHSAMSIDNDWRNCLLKVPDDDMEKLYLGHEKTAWHLKTIVADGRELGEEMPNEHTASISKPVRQVTNNDTNYQKKINPWKLLSASEEIEEYSNTTSKKRCIGEEGLIVVASLLDHLPNLGGLCRTCEIFGVHKYVINSLKVVNDQHFQSLSVSAQNWVNILEVPVRDLESLLLTYSAKGYTILGVEQANESTSLSDFIFPKKSVLLLGNEKMGIPPELLHLVDKCIEIPQVGIIRSLNVHVTGALCIWQYASQNVLK